jgi:hypothetical protein
MAVAPALRARAAVPAHAFGGIAMALARRVPAPPSAGLLSGAPRGLCGVSVDMTCRVYSCKVADDSMAHQLDLLMDEFIEKVEGLDGYAGAARLVCKSEWDYKLVIKFRDLDSLKDFMSNTHPQLEQTFKPRIEQLIGGKVHEQNFVYDDIE